MIFFDSISQNNCLKMSMAASVMEQPCFMIRIIGLFYDNFADL